MEFKTLVFRFTSRAPTCLLVPQHFLSLLQMEVMRTTSMVRQPPSSPQDQVSTPNPLTLTSHYMRRGLLGWRPEHMVCIITDPISIHPRCPGDFQEVRSNTVAHLRLLVRICREVWLQWAQDISTEAPSANS